MPLSPLTAPASPAQCVPFAQATPQQVSQAFLYIQHELEARFPAVELVYWAYALVRFKPDLWIQEQTVFLIEDDLNYLVQRLSESEELPELVPLIHGPYAGYLAKKMVQYEDDAIHALADIEAQPLAYGPLVYRLVVSLALGNSVADKVFQATDQGHWGRPGGTGRDLPRATIHERLQALRRDRGEVEFAAFGQSISPAGAGHPGE